MSNHSGGAARRDVTGDDFRRRVFSASFAAAEIASLALPETVALAQRITDEVLLAVAADQAAYPASYGVGLGNPGMLAPEIGRERGKDLKISHYRHAWLIRMCGIGRRIVPDNSRSQRRGNHFALVHDFRSLV